MRRLVTVLVLLLAFALPRVLAGDDLFARARVQAELFTALKSGDSASATRALQRLSLCWNDPACPGKTAISELTRAAQSLSLFGEGRRAFDLLKSVQHSRPNDADSPVFYYQMFFTALYGIGDRATAREILDTLTQQVRENRLSPTCPEFVAVSSGWYRSLQMSDSDLLRQQHVLSEAALTHAAPAKK